MVKYLTFNIKALENLKFSKTNMQVEAEETMEYIPGTAIRGAYIYRYIVEKKVKDINKGENREKLLNGKIKFLNAYPVYKGKRSIPFPKAYFAEKEKIKLKSDNLPMVPGLDKSLDPNYDRVRGPEFVMYEEKKIFPIKIEKTSNLHINKMKGKEVNKLFRYESMEKGQVFQAVIKLEDEKNIEEVKELFENKIIYLGGSKGSGYGKCETGEMTISVKNPEAELMEDYRHIENQLYILAMSDIIYSNRLGEYMTYIDEEEIKEKLNLDSVEYVDSVIDTKNISNFNNKWKASTPNITSIKAGSVFKYKISGKLDNILLEKFIEEGLGNRKLDGFGRIIILSDIKNGTLIRGKLENRKSKDIYMEELDFKDKEFLQDIINNIYINRLKNDTSRIIIEIDGKLVNTREMNLNQWGSLLNLFSNMYGETSLKGKEKAEKYFTNIKNKRSSSYRQINRVTYKSSSKNKSLLEFMEEFVENSTDIKALQDRSKVEILEIKGVKAEIDKEFAYKYNIEILKELCRYQRREEY